MYVCVDHASCLTKPIKQNAKSICYLLFAICVTADEWEAKTHTAHIQKQSSNRHRTIYRPTENGCHRKNLKANTDFYCHS